MAVIEGDWAGVGDSVKAELLGVLRISRPDVLPPGEGEYLSRYRKKERDVIEKEKPGMLFLFPVVFKLWKI
jgi:hypothetical protein